MFGRTWQEIAEMIHDLLLLPKWAKTIVRRSMLRPGGGVGDIFTYFYRLPPGGKPGEALTKLPTNQPLDSFLERHSVGWRKPGTPRFMGAYDSTYQVGAMGPGPPCGTRVYSHQKLRDNDLIEGVNNQDRFGYAMDLWRDDATSSGAAIDSWWYRRVINLPNSPVGSGDGGYWASSSDPTGTDGQFPLQTWGSNGVGSILRSENQSSVQYQDHPTNGGPDRTNYTGWARIIAYVTRAEFPYRFVMSYNYEGQPPADKEAEYARLFIPMGTFTGRFVSEWLPATPWVKDWNAEEQQYNPPRRLTLEKPVYGSTAGVYANVYTQSVPRQNTIVTIEHSSGAGRTTGSPEQLAKGQGPLCMPFLEVEQKSTYNPQHIWEIQNEDTPEEWRTTQMQKLIDAGQWPYPISWPY